MLWKECFNSLKLEWAGAQVSWIESILKKYCDETLQPKSNLATQKTAGKLKILETYPKTAEISLLCHILVHLGIFITIESRRNCHVLASRVSLPVNGLVIWGCTKTHTFFQNPWIGRVLRWWYTEMENMPLTRPRFSEESGLQVYTHFVEKYIFKLLDTITILLLS